jgi:hypothetical protein
MDRDGNHPGFFASAITPDQGLNKIEPQLNLRADSI